MTTRMAIKNRQAMPVAVIRVWHEGPDDYRVHIENVGEHSRAPSLGKASEIAYALAGLSGPDFAYEALKTLDKRVTV